MWSTTPVWLVVNDFDNIFVVRLLLYFMSIGGPLIRTFFLLWVLHFDDAGKLPHFDVAGNKSCSSWSAFTLFWLIFGMEIRCWEEPTSSKEFWLFSLGQVAVADGHLYHFSPRFTHSNPIIDIITVWQHSTPSCHRGAFVAVIIVLLSVFLGDGPSSTLIICGRVYEPLACEVDERSPRPFADSKPFNML